MWKHGAVLDSVPKFLLEARCRRLILPRVTRLPGPHYAIRKSLPSGAGGRQSLASSTTFISGAPRARRLSCPSRRLLGPALSTLLPPPTLPRGFWSGSNQRHFLAEKRMDKRTMEMALVFLHRRRWLISLSRRSRTTETVATQLAGRVHQKG